MIIGLGCCGCSSVPFLKWILWKAFTLSRRSVGARLNPKWVFRNKSNGGFGIWEVDWKAWSKNLWSNITVHSQSLRDWPDFDNEWAAWWSWWKRRVVTRWLLLRRSYKWENDSSFQRSLQEITKLDINTPQETLKVIWHQNCEGQPSRYGIPRWSKTLTIISKPHSRRIQHSKARDQILRDLYLALHLPRAIILQISTSK